MKGKLKVAVLMTAAIFATLAGNAAPAAQSLSLVKPKPCNGERTHEPPGRTAVWALVTITNVQHEPGGTMVRRYHPNKGGYGLVRRIKYNCWNVLLFRKGDVPRKLCLKLGGIVTYEAATPGGQCERVRTRINPDGTYVQSVRWTIRHV